jgi:preprotein translocase subunit SecA
MVVAQAGRKGAITISTNMAGRGTDILLGGNPEAMAKDALAVEKQKMADEAANAKPVETAAEGEGPYRGASEPAFDEETRLKELTAEFKKECDAEKVEVIAAGGLKIVGTERHESRRIDNQLRGRAGRQGDPGVSRFYLSLEDDLLRIFGLDKMAGLMERLGLEEDVPIESPMVTRSIEGAQKKVEGRNFDQRKNVLEYDDVMNQQRKTIYAMRRQVLEGRYVPEQTEEDKKKGLPPPEPPTESGDWTIDGLAVEIRPKVDQLLTTVETAVAMRDKDLAEGKPQRDLRPHWRVLRGEIWRQYGVLLTELEQKLKGPRADLLEYVTTSAAASLIMQRERMFDLCETIIARLIETHCPSSNEEQWDVDALEDAFTEQFNTELELEGKVDLELYSEQLWKVVETKLVEREKELTRPWLMYFARHFLLEEIDQQWIDHLKNMDALREGIGLLGYGQKDPKKEYKRIGFEMFLEMMTNIQLNAATKLFRVEIQKKEEDAVPAEQERRRRAMVEAGAAGKSDGDEAEQKRDGKRRAPAAAAGEKAKPETVRRDRPKVGRNDPCPCGSGKKYKKCHGRDEAEAASE